MERVSTRWVARGEDGAQQVGTRDGLAWLERGCERTRRGTLLATSEGSHPDT